MTLNFQKNDLAMSLNNSLFNDNGQCGFVEKPIILRDLSLGFNPNDTNTMKNKCLLKLKIISAHNLTAQKFGYEIIKDIIDPYVSMTIYGVPADRNVEKTKVVKVYNTLIIFFLNKSDLKLKDNGFSPFFNQDFEFIINCPELVFIKFEVKDKHTSVDDFIGMILIIRL